MKVVKTGSSDNISISSNPFPSFKLPGLESIKRKLELASWQSVSLFIGPLPVWSLLHFLLMMSYDVVMMSSKSLLTRFDHFANLMI